jgi:soluble lytic murein transglycosylase-like protein
MALCVANAESGLNPRAYNASGAAGLFQLMPLWYRGHWHFDPFDPVANVHYAHLMFLAYGWGPWRGDPCVGG